MASKRLRSFAANEGEGLKVDMSPMIDMVFLLLIFFLVNAVLIIVKQDENVNIAYASEQFSSQQEEGNGRIVLNVYEDGSFTPEAGSTTPFLEGDDNAIFDYLTKRREEEEQLGYRDSMVLHLRSDSQSAFRHTRKILSIAGRAGLKRVAYSTSPKK